MFGMPETPEEIALAMRQDELESRYYIYDIANKAVIYDENIFYSSSFSVDFEVINDSTLYLITQVGTAEVLEDHSLLGVSKDVLFVRILAWKRDEK